MPFFCLLEDDNLVTSLAVRTIQLLEEKVDESTVELLVGVRIGRTKNTWGTALLADAERHSVDRLTELDHMGLRDDFSAEAKRILAARVGLLCANPECRAATAGRSPTRRRS